MFNSLSRIIRTGWLNFWRNRWLSSTAVLVMSLTIFGISSLLLINVLINSLSENLENKIDISVYFNIDASEEEVIGVRDDLVNLNQVRSVEYISREMALQNFKQKHQDNPVVMQSLEELEGNPLEASLNIKAQQASQYGAIADFFNQDKYQKIIDKINYLENKAVIDRLSSMANAIQRTGFIILMILAGMAILVAFNTIRLTIYSTSKEIKVMKLVGASNWFVRGPFIIEGALYGITASLIALVVIYPAVWYFSPKITTYLPGTDLLYFFEVNFLAIFLLQLGIGIILGSLSSFIAIRRYLED